MNLIKCIRASRANTQNIFYAWSCETDMSRSYHTIRANTQNLLGMNLRANRLSEAIFTYIMKELHLALVKGNVCNLGLYKNEDQLLCARNGSTSQSSEYPPAKLLQHRRYYYTI